MAVKYNFKYDRVHDFSGKYTNKMEKDGITKTAQITPRTALIWTIIAIIGFLGMFFSFGFVEESEAMKYVLTYFAVLGHLALIPITYALAAPTWAKIGGYSWAIVDTILSIATLHGANDNVIQPLRLGMHTLIAVWPLGVAITSKGFIRWAGYLLAATIGVVPLLGKLVPSEIMFIAAPFIFIFLGAVAWKFKTEKGF